MKWHHSVIVFVIGIVLGFTVLALAGYVVFAMPIGYLTKLFDIAQTLDPAEGWASLPTPF